MGLVYTMLSTGILLLKLLICISSLVSIAIVLVCKYLKFKYNDKPSEIREVVKNGKYKNAKIAYVTKEDGGKSFVYDVAIVGGGPAGGTCAYYCVDFGIKVCILERKKYPRDKYCGDALCVPAIRICKEMGVMQTLIDNNEIEFADSGGFVSPSGLCYLGKSAVEVGEPLAGAVKRIILDERVVRNSEKKGADLFEECDIEKASFDQTEGMWTAVAADGRSFKARVLVCCDGAQSNLARKLGMVTEAPKGVCTRAFVKPGTHNSNLDGICFYPPHSMPWYCAVFRHVGDELNFAYYLIPCGDNLGDCLESDIASLHKYALTEDPFVSKLMGPKAEIETMRVAPLRVACQGVKASYDDHLMLVGDAAGFIDPITGEGIQNAMMSGRDAGLTLRDMFKEGDFSSTSMAQYKDRWMTSFGYDFRMSSDAAWLIWKFPILIDAAAYYVQCGGTPAFADWAKIMTMLEGKELFLEPRLAFNFTFAIIRVWFNKNILSLVSPQHNYSYNSTWKRAPIKQ